MRGRGAAFTRINPPGGCSPLLFENRSEAQQVEAQVGLAAHKRFLAAEWSELPGRRGASVSARSRPGRQARSSIVTLALLCRQ